MVANNGNAISEMTEGCAVITRNQEVPPIGTSPGSEVRGYLFIEFPQPWSSKIDETPGFPVELVDVTKQNGYKILAMMSPGSSLTRESILEDDFCFTALMYQKPTGPIKRYKKLELKVPRKHLKEVIEAGMTGSLEKIKSYLVDPVNDELKDVFICIHGSRDECCGEFGSKLLEELNTRRITNVRIWGVSHVGKHIFAPNVMIFPEGQLWGHVTPQVLESIIRRSSPISEVAHFYRGTIGFDPAVQVLELEILKKQGWKWFDYHRQGWISKENDQEGLFKVMIDYFDDTMSQVGSYEGDVTLLKSEKVLSSKCSPSIRFKISKVTNLIQAVIELKD